MLTKVFKNERISFVELRYLAEVTSCEKKHIHENLTITAIEAGKLRLFFDKTLQLLTPETLAIINPYQSHFAELSELESKGGYVLYLDRQWCARIQSSLLQDSIAQTPITHAAIKHAPITNNQQNFIPLDQQLISSKILFLEFIQLCKSLFENTFVIEKEEKLTEFLVKILQLGQEKIPTANAKKALKNTLSAKLIKELLDDNPAQDLLLDDIAKQTGFSVTHCLRVFKKEYGLPIHAYILNEKIHKAKELLSTHMPLADTAIECGFYDQSHLTKSFKQVFQLTPKQYQDNIFH